MGRPSRNDVDYFPFLCKEGKAMFIIDKKWGNDGYATWIKTLRALAVTNHHFLDFRKKEDVFFHAVKCNVSEELLFEILFELAKMGEFDLFLWNQGIVYSDKFIDNILEAYKKRSNKLFKKEELMLQIGIKVQDSAVSTSVNPLKVDVKPQSILEYTILDNIKIKEEILNSQSWLEATAKNNGTDVKSLIEIFEKFWTMQVYETNNENKTQSEIQKHFGNWLKTNKPPQIKFTDEWGERGEDYFPLNCNKEADGDRYIQAIAEGWEIYNDYELRMRIIKKDKK